MFPSSTKREIRHFHVVVVQRWQRNVQKSVMQVQRCCFANINPLQFFRSHCRRHRRCLSSLVIHHVGPARKSYLFGHMINPLLTTLVRSGWLNICLALFCVYCNWPRLCQKITWPISNHVNLMLGQWHLYLDYHTANTTCSSVRLFLRVEMHVKVPDNNNMPESPKPLGKAQLMADYCSLYIPKIRKRGYIQRELSCLGERNTKHLMTGREGNS